MHLKNKKKLLILPISITIIAILFIGIRLLMPYICFRSYTNKALAASTLKTINYHVDTCTVLDSRDIPNQVYKSEFHRNDLFDYVQCSKVFTDKLGNSHFTCIQCRDNRRGKHILKDYRMPETAKTICEITVRHSGEDNNEHRGLHLILLRYKCCITIDAEINDYNDAERIAKYFGVTLPPENTVPVGEYFVIN